MDATNQGKRATAIQRSRRNVLAMAGIITSATIVGSRRSAAFGGDPCSPRPSGVACDNCFLKGTRISTPLGEREVEDLRVNDLVITSSGEAKPIQSVSVRHHERQPGQKWPDEIKPIRVAQSALGPNNPHCDLYLSRYHCLYLDGVLIPAVDLLNNSTITRYSAEDLREIEYFHIKLERHSVIYAEGAACETLLGAPAAVSENVDFSLPEKPAAPILGYNGRRAMLRGHLRSAISPLIDIRTKLDMVRDDLAERAVSSLAICDSCATL
jgi:Hint domain